MFLQYTCMLYNIYKNMSLPISIFEIKICPLMLFYYILSINKDTTILKYTCMNNLFEKSTIQTCPYLLSIFWFCLWVHVPNGIVNIFKFIIHYLLVFRWIINDIQGLFDQRKCSFVIRIIYPTSNNN